MKEKPAFFEFEIEFIAQFFDNASNDREVLLVESSCYLDPTLNLVYFTKDSLQNFVLKNERARSTLFKRVIAALEERGVAISHVKLSPPGFPNFAKMVKVLAIRPDLVPPADHWGAVREIDVVAEDMEGVRVNYFAENEADRKIRIIQRKYGNNVDKAELNRHYKRYLPTEKDYEVKTTKVLILNQALTSELAPPPAEPNNRNLWDSSIREPKYEAYAFTLLNECEEGESVIYPLFPSKSINHQQILLRAAVERWGGGGTLRTERYGDRYLRLRLDGRKK